MGWVRQHLRNIALLVGLAVALSACGGSPDTTSRPPSMKSSSAFSNKTPPTVKVVKGDTVYGISRRYGVSPQDIIRQNNLRAPYHLEVGQVLRMPVEQIYTVIKGDTIYGISRRYGVDMSELTRVNGIKAPYTLEIGDKLKLPPQTRTATRTASRSISKAPSKPSTPPPPPRAGDGFTWPVKGQILSSFGPKKGGLHNDGINIAAKKGDPIKVTDAGTIVYVGNELAGFGNLVLVRHSGGWVSAYGHLSQVLVKRGGTVKRGQTIARAGTTGSVTKPQLHFELRKGSAAVDPRKYLPGV